MDIFKLLRLECIEVDAGFADKQNALKAVARVAKRCRVLDTVSEEQVLSGLTEREELGSTGFGKGIAIPHCRIKDIQDFVVGILTVPDGVDFKGLDDKPVRLIVFIIGPDRETTDHIRILSALSRTLNIPGIIEEIVSQPSPESIYESFLRSSRDYLAPGKRREKQLVHVFIQDDELFKDILNVFSAVETSSVAIIEGKNTREYLFGMPLFAGLWTDSHLGFNRIISALIDKKLTNETLRAVENITGSLDRRTDILVVVQDVFYTAGSLEP